MILPAWLFVRHGLQNAYFCFHCSVAILIAAQVIRRNPLFFKGLYILYVIQSFFDACSFFFVSVQKKVAAETIHVKVKTQKWQQFTSNQALFAEIKHDLLKIASCDTLWREKKG